MGLLDWLFGPAQDPALDALKSAVAAKKRRDSAPKLEGSEEHLAQRLAKLLYSASFHESRDARAYDGAREQLSRLGDEMRSRGPESWERVLRRTAAVCDDNMPGLAPYLALLGDPPSSR